jgi:hypothetical protein
MGINMSTEPAIENVVSALADNPGVWNMAGSLSNRTMRYNVRCSEVKRGTSISIWTRASEGENCRIFWVPTNLGEVRILKLGWNCGHESTCIYNAVNKHLSSLFCTTSRQQGNPPHACFRENKCMCVSKKKVSRSVEKNCRLAIRRLSNSRRNNIPIRWLSVTRLQGEPSIHNIVFETDEQVSC